MGVGWFFGLACKRFYRYADQTLIYGNQTLFYADQTLFYGMRWQVMMDFGLFVRFFLLLGCIVFVVCGWRGYHVPLP